MATSDSPLSVPDVTLAVARVSSGGDPAGGGTGALAYSAPNGLADGQLITLTTNGSEGWDFGSAPTELATMGFGQGLLYTANEGLTFQEHVDPHSGAMWTWERDDFDPSRQIVTEEGIRALRTENEAGGFLNYIFNQYVPENSKLFISTMSKSNYDFVNDFLGENKPPIEIATVSTDRVTLVEPWPYASATNSSSTMLAADPSNIDAGSYKTGGTFTNGSTTVLITGNPLEAGVQPGWVAGRSTASQWKGLRLSDIGGFGSDAALPERNNIYMTPNNGTQAGFYPNTSRWTYGVPNNIYGFPGDMFYKGWARNDQQLEVGTFGNTDGVVSGNLIVPDENYVRYNVNVTTGRNHHDINRRLGAASWQEFTVGVLNSRMHRTDFFVQVGTLARMELADGDSPATSTASFILPPVRTEWSTGSIRVLLWKSLFTEYIGKYIHFFDSNGVFRKAVAL